MESESLALAQMSLSPSASPFLGSLAQHGEHMCTGKCACSPEGLYLHTTLSPLRGVGTALRSPFAPWNIAGCASPLESCSEAAVAGTSPQHPYHHLETSRKHSKNIQQNFPKMLPLQQDI